MTPRPDQIAQQIEEWIAVQFPDIPPADIAAALDLARRRATARSIPTSAALAIAPADIISADGETLGPVTRQQMYDALHAWEQIGQQDAAPARSFWRHTPDYAIHVRYDTPDVAGGPHYVHVTAYHQDTRPGQEHLEDALAQAIVHWSGPPAGPSSR